MIHSLRWVLAVMPLCIAAILFILFTSTSPVSIGPLGLLVVFALVYLFWLSLVFMFLHFGIGVVGKWQSKLRSSNPIRWRLGVRKAYYVASIVAFVPVFLLAMQSLGQLNIRDGLLVGVLTSIAIFYVLKRD